MKRMICSTCGSEDVLCDAFAEWDFDKQKWSLQNTFDKGAYCNACDGECRIKEVEVHENAQNNEESDDQSVLFQQSGPISGQLDVPSGTQPVNESRPAPLDGSFESLTAYKQGTT